MLKLRESRAKLRMGPSGAVFVASQRAMEEEAIRQFFDPAREESMEKVIHNLSTGYTEHKMNGD